MRHFVLGVVILAASLLLSAGSSALPQDKEPVLKKVSYEQLQRYLTALGIAATGHAAKDANGNVTRVAYEFKLGSQSVLLEAFYGGTAIVISSESFNKVPLARINDWNKQKALSRAVLGANQSRLEADLDCELGVTTQTVELFLKRFHKSLEQFEQFIRETPEGAHGGQAITELLQGPVPKEIFSVDAHFPMGADESAAQTQWRVNYRVDRNHGLRIVGAWFKRRGENPEWLKVAEDLHVTQLYVPYDAGKPRYFDMDLRLLPGHAPWKLDKLANGAANILGPHGKVLDDLYTVREDRDAGLLWVFTPEKFKMEQQVLGENRSGSTLAMRRQEMVLWGVYQATNYIYIMQYAFQNDGTVICRLGSTGQNLHKHLTEGSGHMHNTVWRIQLDVGGSGPKEPHLLASQNLAYLVKRLDLPGDNGVATTQLMPLQQEGGHDWNAREFTTLRIHNPSAKNRLGHGASYDVVPLRYGSVRHYAAQRPADPPKNAGGKVIEVPGDEFTQADFWLTSDNPGYVDARELPVYARNKAALGSHPVIWHVSSNYHVPRDEDYFGAEFARDLGCATVMFSGFELRPRSVLRDTPFFGRGQ